MDQLFLITVGVPVKIPIWVFSSYNKVPDGNTNPSDGNNAHLDGNTHTRDGIKLMPDGNNQDSAVKRKQIPPTPWSRHPSFVIKLLI